MRFGVIVEGHADVDAVPVLLRKIAADLHFFGEITIPKAFRLPRGKIVRAEELKKAAMLMAHKTEPDGVIIVIFDADDECPAVLGPKILGWIRAILPNREAIVVLAYREYESWFIASAEAFNGERGLSREIVVPDNHEEIRDAKGWMSANMANGYSATLDQPRFSAVINTEAARRNCSFDKLMRDLTPLFSESAN